jgi:MoxR-like ATPase
VATPADVRRRLEPLLGALDGVILGKHPQVQLCVACVLARGHLLLEDQPGVGKTTLAHALAAVFGLQFQRIQFTSDLLPGDITGTPVFERDGARFTFRPGPVFAQLVLADEVNRASPKTQSALLEAMEERQVTADGVAHALPEPFFVVATQNPTHQVGTFPLPESQLDRFLMRLSLGYPDAKHERELLKGTDRRALVAQLKPLLGVQELLALQAVVPRLHVAEPLLDYVQALVGAVRTSNRLDGGLSPRAALGLVRAAQAHALLQGRPGVLPEDVQAVFLPVVQHRVRPREAAAGADLTTLLRGVLESVALP